MNTWVILGDLQVPFHDKPVLAAVVRFIQELRPHGVILNGDVTDCYLISDFDKDPKQFFKKTLPLEIRQAQALMDELRDVPEKLWRGGNHEDRWRREQWRHPQADGMYREFPEAFRMADYGFVWRPYAGYTRLGKLLVTHGHMVSQHSGISARRHFERYGNSILINHTHRLGAYYRTNTHGSHGAWENGCLCKLTPEYVQNPDWQQGFSVVDVAENGFFTVQQIPILNRREFYYGRERYRVREGR